MIHGIAAARIIGTVRTAAELNGGTKVEPKETRLVMQARKGKKEALETLSYEGVDSFSAGNCDGLQVDGVYLDDHTFVGIARSEWRNVKRMRLKYCPWRQSVRMAAVSVK